MISSRHSSRNPGEDRFIWAEGVRSGDSHTKGYNIRRARGVQDAFVIRLERRQSAKGARKRGERGKATGGMWRAGGRRVSGERKETRWTRSIEGVRRHRTVWGERGTHRYGTGRTEGGEEGGERPWGTAGGPLGGEDTDLVEGR